jgi:histidine ammonia-lyase
MSVTLNGRSLTIAHVVRVAEQGERVEIGRKELTDIARCREFYESIRNSPRPIYGVNTGVGKFADSRLSTADQETFQANLLRSHAAGIGAPAPEAYCRSAMLSKANVHARGRSACRPEITLALLDMLNMGVTPVVCLRGSVSACGDLAPMAQIALLLMGEGEAFFRNERLPGAVAFERAGITIPGVKDRDGLAAINGSNFVTGIFALQLHEMDRLLRHAEIACAMAIEALNGSLLPLDHRLHKARGYPGSIHSAAFIRDCLEGRELRPSGAIEVQDAYSLRATPQIIGGARDALAYARCQVEIELNAVADNPVFFPEDGEFLTGANFQGYPVSLPMDLAGMALTAVCVLSERRLNRLLNPALSRGLPPFLADNPGLNSGMMISQYTAGSLVAEQRILSTPASIGSIPACADQEDFVPMGMNTAVKNMQIIENAYGVIGIEMMAAAQALEVRGGRHGRGTDQALRAIRKHVERLVGDRELHRDHDRMVQLLKSGAILDAVDESSGTRLREDAGKGLDAAS